MLQAYGAYGPKKLYGKEVVGVIRSTFIVDAEGRIERASYNVKATGHVAKLRRDLGRQGCRAAHALRHATSPAAAGSSGPHG